jgi:hypothetical protein
MGCRSQNAEHGADAADEHRRSAFQRLYERYAGRLLGY